MTQTELLADMAARNLEMLKMTLADFSDADMLARPCPGANHAAWQLGHLVNSEARFLAMFKPDATYPLPESYKDKFTKSDAPSDDPTHFPSKAELFNLLSAIRAQNVLAIQSLTPADLEKPAPQRLQSRAPTLAHVAAMLTTHCTMHLGQFQVIRRKLGKPVLF